MQNQMQNKEKISKKANQKNDINLKEEQIKKYKVNSKEERAITLIALVITIIVLLILAGVTIAALSGDNGILTQTAKSKIENAKGEIKDKIALKQLEDLENAEPETEVYDSILNKIDNEDEAIEIKGNEIKYNAEKFTDIEQRILRNEIELGSVQDTTKPYGTIEKEVVDGKVKLKIYTADDETDIRKIILPDGTEKKIEYNTEKILYRYNDTINEDSIENITNSSKIRVTRLKTFFKNINIDCNISNVNEIKEKYNIVVDMNEAWGTKNSVLLKNIFNEGINLITSGNDSNNLYIFKDSKTTTEFSSTQNLINNEITKYYVAGNFNDTRSSIHYIDGVQVWTTEEVDGSTYDIIGILKGEKENYWLDIHDIRQSENNNAILTRNSIYRVLGTRSAEYEVTQNGIYTFKIEDLSGNVEELSIEITEI